MAIRIIRVSTFKLTFAPINNSLTLKSSFYEIFSFVFPRYDTRWYLAPLPVQKLLVLLLNWCKKSSCLLTGGIFVASFETLLSVMELPIPLIFGEYINFHQLFKPNHLFFLDNKHVDVVLCSSMVYKVIRNSRWHYFKNHENHTAINYQVLNQLSLAVVFQR